MEYKKVNCSYFINKFYDLLVIVKPIKSGNYEQCCEFTLYFFH
jgi:hypothetical protein